MAEATDPGRDRPFGASGQLLLTAALGVALAAVAAIEVWHANRVGLLVLVAVPLAAAVLLDRRAAVTLSLTCAVLGIVLPGSLWETSTVHFVRVSGITAACAAAAAGAFWRERLALTLDLYGGARGAATENLMRGWRQSTTQGPQEASRLAVAPSGQHERALVSLLEVARFDEEALELALAQNDWQRAHWLAKGLLGTWVDVVGLFAPADTPAHSG